MENTFKVGDRVQTHDGNIFGRIVQIETITNYHIRDDEDGYVYTRQAEQLEYKRLSPEDAWIEVALLVGYKVEEAALPLYESEKSNIRHRAYQILGGRGIKVDEPVRARVRALIERAKSLHNL